MTGKKITITNGIYRQCQTDTKEFIVRIYFDSKSNENVALAPTWVVEPMEKWIRVSDITEDNQCQQCNKFFARDELHEPQGLDKMVCSVCMEKLLAGDIKLEE